MASARFSRAPERTVTVACHGPAAIPGSRSTVTGAVSPGASVVPTSMSNGPARVPPGPSSSRRLPVRSSARCPVFSTLAVTTGRPSSPRDAVNDRISKSDGGSPAGPIETYMRTPTRCTVAMPPPGAGARASAQTTP